MIYNLVYASAVLTNFLTYLSFQARRKAYYFVFALMFCFVTFRWDVGCDWGGYLNHAINHGGMPFEDAIHYPEPGYWLLVVILNRLGLEYPAINVFASLSFFSGMHALAKRQPDPLVFITLAFPILMTGIAMSATRQGLAIGFLCFAFVAFSENKLTKYVMFVLIASTFHKSSLGFLAFTAFLVPLAARYRILAAIAAVPPLALLIGGGATDSYTSLYLGGKHDAAGGPARALIVAGSGVAFHFLKERWRKYSPDDFNLVNSMYPALILMFPLTFISSVMGDRFGYSLMPIALLIQSKAYLVAPRNSAMAMFLTPILVTGAALLVWSQFSWIFASCYLPYNTWWWSGG